LRSAKIDVNFDTANLNNDLYKKRVAFIANNFENGINTNIDYTDDVSTFNDLLNRFS